MKKLIYRCVLNIVTLRCGRWLLNNLRVVIVGLIFLSAIYGLSHLDKVPVLSLLPGEPYLYNETYHVLTVDKSPVTEWLKSGRCFCGGHFCGFANRFALLSHVLVDPKFCHGRRGGENLKDVINQNEKLEYLTLKRGFFKLKCKEQNIQYIHTGYRFNKKDHLRFWPALITNHSTNVPNHEYSIVTNFTIAVLRYEYVNLYHTLTDLYNAFMMLETFGKNASSSTILWFDAHPEGGLDHIWSTLFGNVLRVGQIENKTLFREMVWSITGYYSALMDHKLEEVPYLEPFREFFLTRFGIYSGSKLDCRKLRILFIWRRDYVAHPRNPEGKVKRKIKNERELESAVKNKFPTADVRGLQMDNLTIDSQLKIIAKTDILIGMHGAGLTLALFLPKHSSIIELYPFNKPTKNKHFQKIANWRNLKYRRWQNRNIKNELKNGFTYIPPYRLLELVTDTVKEMCN